MMQTIRIGRAVGLRWGLRSLCLIGFLLTVLNTNRAFAQVDQGTITGVVQDSTGAVIPDADVALSNTDTGLALQAKSNASGVYVFSPIKIRQYNVSASAPNFQTTVQQNLTLHVDRKSTRLNSS